MKKTLEMKIEDILISVRRENNESVKQLKQQLSQSHIKIELEVKSYENTISEVSKQLHIPVSTIRYYDSQGLLPFIERSKNGVRIFKEDDYHWLQVIECLKKTGLSLNRIKEYIDLALQGDDTIDQRYEIMLQQKERLIKKLEDINHALNVIDEQCWLCKTPKN